MPLSGDQRAMLQLLLERGQSYEDIASLLGLGTDEVRGRARTALAEIGGSDPDGEVGLTDYLLGQADPIGRADVARHLQADPGARDLAEKLVTQLRVLAPGAELPEIPAAASGRGGRAATAAAKPKPAEAPAPPAGAGRWPGSAGTLTIRQRRLIAGLAGGGVLVVIVVLIAAGAFGGDDSSGDGGSGTAVAETETTAADGSGAAAADGSGAESLPAAGRTFAILTAQDGSDAAGAAQFGRIRQRAYLQVDLTGLEPSPEGKNYVIWFYGSDRSAFPLSFEKVGENGQLRGLAPIPVAVLGALQQGVFDSVDVSLTDVSELRAALREARRSRNAPPYVGESVLRGPIQGPGAEAAKAPAGSGATPDNGGG